MYRTKPPKTPRALMYAGILPFAGCLTAMVFAQDNPGQTQLAALIMVVYGAVILSFVGGVRWGVEMTKRERPRLGELLASILGALFGWALVIGFFQLEYTMRPWLCVGMAALFIVYYFYDLTSRDVPQWYRSARIWPTLGAAISLLGCAYFISV